MKNEKFLLDIQTKCGDIANEILKAAIDAERTFKCKRPKQTVLIFWTKLVQKTYLLSKAKQMNITTKFSILGLDQVPIFILGRQF